MINNDENSRTNIPENDPSKAMNSKRDVEQSPDEKTDEDFPGYPHYPSKEDIMDQRTGSHRVDANLEQMGSGSNNTGLSQRYPANQNNNRAQEGSGGGTNEEIGLPQNVSTEDLDTNSDLPGTDVDEAAEKGSLNP